MIVEVYPKLVVVVSTDDPDPRLAWPPQSSAAARRIFNALMRDRPTWDLVGFYYKDDEGSHRV